MEAPEKIYVDNPTYNFWYLTKEENSIEYIRTDVFIDKVCELLARMIWEVTYEDLEGNSIHHYDKMEFIEDFKKAMEEKI